jgi:hypothetical protein
MAMAALRKPKQYMDAQDSSATKTTPMTILDEVISRVWQALNSEQYDWRSVDGIVRETGLPERVVSQVLERDLAEKVVRSVNKDNPNEYLYASRDRYNKIRGPWNRILSVVTSQVK